MKKIIVALFLGLSFVACDNNDDEVNKLEGKWFPEAVVVNGESIAYVGNTSCGNDYLQLNAFNTFEIADFYEDDTTAKNSPVAPCPVTKFYGSYNVLNNELKLYGSSFFQGGTIVENSASRLQLKRMIDVDGNGSLDEVIEVYRK
ncbi:hypothetical protein P3875_05805 [Myroides sp. JBRI-B21084]|uniref:hypothetical protein n=1 Tax=Myroides sp. JBRI-B21084 TaxID=3119977 RepID=UPI0026E15B94|nr:hypothetical protein [Paenimyroides cloacae]WKW47568.1 hypothetical protein P3875_05805 [Paenimyroides cloacae]